MELEARGADAETTWWQGDSEKYMTCSSKGPAFFQPHSFFSSLEGPLSTLRALFCFLFNLIVEVEKDSPAFPRRMKVSQVFRVIVKLVSIYTYIYICV